MVGLGQTYDETGALVDNYGGFQTATGQWLYGSGTTYAPPVPSGSGSSSSSGSFWDALSSAIGGASKIFSTRYSVPQLNPGQYIQTTPYGSTMYQLEPGQTSSFSTSLLGAGSSLSSMLPILLIGGVLLFALKK